MFIVRFVFVFVKNFLGSGQGYHFLPCGIWIKACHFQLPAGSTFSSHDDDADADDHHDHDDDDDDDDDNDDGDDADGLGLNYKVLDMSTQKACQNNIQCTEYELLCSEILSSKYGQCHYQYW